MKEISVQTLKEHCRKNTLKIFKKDARKFYQLFLYLIWVLSSRTYGSLLEALWFPSANVRGKKGKQIILTQVAVCGRKASVPKWTSKLFLRLFEFYFSNSRSKQILWRTRTLIFLPGGNLTKTATSYKDCLLKKFAKQALGQRFSHKKLSMTFPCPALRKMPLRTWSTKIRTSLSAVIPKKVWQSNPKKILERPRKATHAENLFLL